MKGLFRKDFYVLRSIGLAFILLDLFFCLIPDLRFYPFAAFYTVMLSMILMQTDEQCKWDTLLPMLPVSRRQVVLEKYTFGWGYMALTAVLALGGQLIWQRIDGFMAVDGTYFTVLCLDLCLALVMQGMLLPVLFRFGTAKGRLILILAVGMVTGATVGIIGSGFETLAASLANFRGWHFLLIGAALSALSVPLSLAGYKKRLMK